jgi:Uma2 family endonuclease
MKVRLHIQNQDIFYYPDLFLSCDPNDRATYYRTPPCLLVEVLSESTARIDRRKKFWAYQTIHCLSEYLLISQTAREVGIYRRADGWAQEIVGEGSIRLKCLDVELALDVIYEDVMA